MGTTDEQIDYMRGRYEWARGRSFEREQPACTVSLPAFHIGRYPVTNVEYHAFVSSTGYRAPAYWYENWFADLEYREFVLWADYRSPNYWYESAFPKEAANHPVDSVSWYDAQAYVEWLRERTGKPYRLPTEAEWEKAARGEDGRLWPWGNTWNSARANCQPDPPWSFTRVGQYSPAGDSPYGCADMVGNVHEWTQSAFWEYPYDPADGREDLTGGDEVPRVLRGGGFWANESHNRCAVRGWEDPDDRGKGFGFRVAVAPDPSTLRP
jgi:formylglycine-generating enzyme required for sulfatase activity